MSGYHDGDNGFFASVLCCAHGVLRRFDGVDNCDGCIEDREAREREAARPQSDFTRSIDASAPWYRCCNLCDFFLGQHREWCVWRTIMKQGLPRKPTRQDLLVVVGRMQGIIDRLESATNDRNVNRAADIRYFAELGHALGVMARSQDPPKMKETGPWSEDQLPDDMIGPARKRI